ncbi:CoA ligase [Rhynchospora pubera]|uniref:4-coumarate--CoA ligase n=1 Tax=Rhynchospora pubera TaxID=906938 RepID=A0AAV8BQN0_9POAL|nr:CoA ligase [Rhynchospora pubera]KAJ4806098.1 CoA ligase [Rhynchospora pubera]
MDAYSLPKNDANFAELTPLTFIHRAALAYGNHTSVVYDNIKFTWKQTYERCLRLAAWLQSFGIRKNDVVSILAPNVPALYESHFGVPMAGAVLNTINTRLDAAAIAGILRHSGAKIIFVDHQLLSLATDALSTLTSRPEVVLIDDISSTKRCASFCLQYEQVLASANPVAYPPVPVTNEWDAIALNYTSGTTSEPKGVVYSHRGAYLSTMTLLLQWGVGLQPVYLWSLPMFHCNGWTFTWGMAARGGTNVCLRSPSARDMYQAISRHGVTHMCGAPVLFNVLLDPTECRQLTRPVHMLTGGAPPPAALLESIESVGFRITHAYGLTEATGPALVCEWQQDWNRLPAAEKARLKARQGVGALTLADVDVKDKETMISVPRDGVTQGEICLRGSSIMKGYFKNKKETDAAFKNGWFLTGDVGVMHSDGYIEIKDRSKDVIISGGENISSVEVEAALYRHPMVLEAAVVAMPHPHWGEMPCAFIALKKEYASNEAGIEEGDIISYCRDKLSHYMVPRKVVFLEELPKTSTGKVQKFILRNVAKGMQKNNSKGEANSSRRVERQINDINRQPEARVEHVMALSRL